MEITNYKKFKRDYGLEPDVSKLPFLCNQYPKVCGSCSCSDSEFKCIPKL